MKPTHQHPPKIRPTAAVFGLTSRLDISKKHPPKLTTTTNPLPHLAEWPAAPRPAATAPQKFRVRIDTSRPITMLEIATSTVPTLDTAKGQASKRTGKEVAEVISRCAVAADAIAKGQGERMHWVSLCSSLNISRAVEAGGVVRGMREHWLSIESVLLAIADRAGEDDHPPTWRVPELTLDEIDAVRLLVQLHEFQLQQLSFGEYTAAVDRAIAWAKSQHGEVVHLPLVFEVMGAKK